MRAPRIEKPNTRTNRDIAEAMVIAESTAAKHIEQILNKLGFGSRAQVAVWVAQRDVQATRGE